MLAPYQRQQRLQDSSVCLQAPSQGLFQHAVDSCLPFIMLTCLSACLLQRAKKQREEVGVELYGFQQSLAKLQMSLEKAQGNYQSLSESRVQVGTAQMPAHSMQAMLPCQAAADVHNTMPAHSMQALLPCQAAADVHNTNASTQHAGHAAMPSHSRCVGGFLLLVQCVSRCATCCRQSRRWRSCGRGCSRSSRPTSMKSSGWVSLPHGRTD